MLIFDRLREGFYESFQKGGKASHQARMVRAGWLIISKVPSNGQGLADVVWSRVHVTTSSGAC
jgi:hypothetical protein